MCPYRIYIILMQVFGALFTLGRTMVDFVSYYVQWSGGFACSKEETFDRPVSAESLDDYGSVDLDRA